MMMMIVGGRECAEVSDLQSVNLLIAALLPCCLVDNMKPLTRNLRLKIFNLFNQATQISSSVVSPY